MNKAPFFAGVQQDLYFLPLALKALAAAGGDGRSPYEVVDDAIRNEGLGIEHLEGLGLFGTDVEDENGFPVLPAQSAVLPAMAEDCLDQLLQLGFVDDGNRVTPKGHDCIGDRKVLREALPENYRIAGVDGEERRVDGAFRRVCGWIRDAGEERRDKPESARYRPALCLAEFMRLNFWLSGVHGKEDFQSRSARRFAKGIVATRRKALKNLAAGEGGIEYAALVMADGAAEWLEDTYGEEAWAKIAAARSSALTLCNARVLYPVGLPGGLQWLRPVNEWRPGRKSSERRKRKEMRETGQ